MTPGATADAAPSRATSGHEPGVRRRADTLSGLTSFGMPQVNPGSIAQTDLSPYMNPFTQQVIGSGMQAIDTQRQQALNTNADQAISQKAFGGSRQGVQEGVTNAAAADAGRQSRVAAWHAGLSTARTARRAGHRARTSRARSPTRARPQSGRRHQSGGAQAPRELGGAGPAVLLQSLMGALQGQQLGRATRSRSSTPQQPAYGERSSSRSSSFKSRRAGCLGMTPYGSTSTQTSQLPGGNGLMQGLGAGATGLGILGSMFGAPGRVPDGRRGQHPV
jgi:hypothetical protein